MASKVDISRHSEVEISEKQEVAIMALLSGATDEAAAKLAGVTRPTVNDWKNNNLVFRVELRNRRAGVWKECQQGLQESLLQALKAVSGAIKAGDIRTSQWMLERAGIEEVSKSILNGMRVTETTIDEQKENAKRAEETAKMFSLPPLSFN